MYVPGGAAEHSGSTEAAATRALSERYMAIVWMNFLSGDGEIPDEDVIRLLRQNSSFLVTETLVFIHDRHEHSACPCARSVPTSLVPVFASLALDRSAIQFADTCVHMARPTFSWNFGNINVEPEQPPRVRSLGKLPTQGRGQKVRHRFGPHESQATSRRTVIDARR